MSRHLDILLLPISAGPRGLAAPAREVTA